MKQEVDLAIARLLRQEVIEKSKRQGLESLLKEVAGMEDEIGNWSAEERRQNKLIAVLSAQREMKAREATRAQAAEKDTREQVKVKELVILDLSKKYNEVNNRLKEFSALYDVVKNERNKYVSLIQSSSQALAEMKEKIKILMNEVIEIAHSFHSNYQRCIIWRLGRNFAQRITGKGQSLGKRALAASCVSGTEGRLASRPLQIAIRISKETRSCRTANSRN